MAGLRVFLADWRNGRQKDIDPALMDILWDIQLASRHRDTYEVISAYRSPETNDMLRGRSNGVARNSQHIPARPSTSGCGAWTRANSGTPRWRCSGAA